MDKIIWLLDAGHGGMYLGKYQTAGKRSPIWDDGSQLFEGVFNRSVINRIAERLDFLEIPYIFLHHLQDDTPLSERILTANAAQTAAKQDGKTCVLLSVHTNAGGGKGWEVFTSRGETKSDKIASVFFEAVQNEFSELSGKHFRTDYSDGDPDKEQGFAILRKTSMPAVLTENFFMDNPIECQKYLLTSSGRDRIAAMHVDAIKRISISPEEYV